MLARDTAPSVLLVGPLGAICTSPCALASACLAAISAFDGRPRFLGGAPMDDDLAGIGAPLAVGLGWSARGGSGE